MLFFYLVIAILFTLIIFDSEDLQFQCSPLIITGNPAISPVPRWIGTSVNVLTEAALHYFQPTARTAQFVDYRMCIVHDGIPSQAILVRKALDSSRM